MSHRAAPPEARLIVQHAGYTSAFPGGDTPEDILIDAARYAFEKYARQRPQLRFSEPEFFIEHSILLMSERGAWRATAVVVWK